MVFALGASLSYYKKVVHPKPCMIILTRVYNNQSGAILVKTISSNNTNVKNLPTSATRQSNHCTNPDNEVHSSMTTHPSTTNDAISTSKTPDDHKVYIILGNSTKLKNVMYICKYLYSEEGSKYRVESSINK